MNCHLKGHEPIINRVYESHSLLGSFFCLTNGFEYVDVDQVQAELQLDSLQVARRERLLTLQTSRSPGTYQYPLWVGTCRRS